jgi:hypothetical protein
LCEKRAGTALQEMLEFCGDKGIEPMVEVMKLSEVGLKSDLKACGLLQQFW